MKNYFHPLISNREWEFPSMGLIFENTRNLGKSYFQSFYGNEEETVKNKVAVVTGASSGIGRAIALELAARGAKVVLASRNGSILDDLAGDIVKRGGTALSVPTDVSDELQCKVLINKTIQAYGQMDILVNNAGISMRANFSDVRISVLKKLMDTNFWGSVYCTRFAFPYLLESRGSIVGISSICGITPLPGRTGYVASKHALDGFLETLRIENIGKGLHVMLVHPGFTNSDIRHRALDGRGFPQVSTPREEDSLMTAERVAEEVVEGIIHKKKDITLTTEGRLITWLYRHAPLMAEKIIHREMKQESGAPF